MLIGITVRPRPFTPPVQGLSALGSFDFVNGVYTWNGITLAAADVVDQPGWITANGLEIPAGAGAGAELIYSAAQTFLADCQFTMVIETEILDTGFSPSTYLFTETNSGQAFFIQASFAAEWELTASDGNTNPFAFDAAHSVSTGVHKLAFTQIDSICSLSVDGNAVHSDSTGVVLPVIGFPMVEFFIGGYSTGTGKAVNIRKLSIYDPVADSTLPSLSA